MSNTPIAGIAYSLYSIARGFNSRKIDTEVAATVPVGVDRKGVFNLTLSSILTLPPFSWHYG
jgi:hypothetical protein